MTRDRAPPLPERLRYAAQEMTWWSVQPQVERMLPELPGTSAQAPVIASRPFPAGATRRLSDGHPPDARLLPHRIPARRRRRRRGLLARHRGVQRRPATAPQGRRRARSRRDLRVAPRVPAAPRPRLFSRQPALPRRPDGLASTSARPLASHTPAPANSATKCTTRSRTRASWISTTACSTWSSPAPSALMVHMDCLPRRSDPYLTPLQQRPLAASAARPVVNACRPASNASALARVSRTRAQRRVRVALGRARRRHGNGPAGSSSARGGPGLGVTPRARRAGHRGRPCLFLEADPGPRLRRPQRKRAAFATRVVISARPPHCLSAGCALLLVLVLHLAVAVVMRRVAMCHGRGRTRSPPGGCGPAC